MLHVANVNTCRHEKTPNKISKANMKLSQQIHIASHNCKYYKIQNICSSYRIVNLQIDYSFFLIYDASFMEDTSQASGLNKGPKARDFVKLHSKPKGSVFS